MSFQSILNPITVKSNDNRLHWGNLHGAAISLAISTLTKSERRPILILADDIQTAGKLENELRFFCGETFPIYRFADWETLAYDHFSPHEDLISQRLLTLNQIGSLKEGIVISALSTSMHQLPPREYIEARTFSLSIAEKLDIQSFREKLVRSGYHHVAQVMTHGEFTFRGSIIDLFPMGSHLPYRIELFDDVIETIRSFDVDDQRSLEKVSQVQLLPAREYPLDKEAIAFFRQRWRERFSGNPMDSSLYSHISDGEPAAGIEYYLKLFFEETANLFEYLPKNTIIITTEHVEKLANVFWSEINERYEQLRYDLTKPLLEPNEVFLGPEQLFSAIKPFTKITYHSLELAEKQGQTNFACEPPPTCTVNHRAKQPLNALNTFIETHQDRILFCAESLGRREVLIDLLKTIAISPQYYSNWTEFLNDDLLYGITVAPLSQGLRIYNSNITIITESQLFGEQVQQRRYRQQRELDPSIMIRNLTELEIGSPVVHINHGVGRFLGLQTIETGEITAEYLMLEYADNDKIYVPVSSLHLISRYTGVDANHAPLQKLGNKQWEKIKDKTLKRVRDVAAELLNVYSQRAASKGYAFSPPGEDFQRFRRAFPFEETPDQTKAIDQVIEDLTQARCMDRLVCGDVGFGKTEVAMQAAFIAVNSGKQVAVLVPTTLLAEQHAQNFKDRFADWPIKIEAISRLKSSKEQGIILNNLVNGKLDIIIGTHKLLSEEVKFHDLGLLIVDEEHRFGVRQKDRIKAMRAHVDILTLTATPIPRTLNMSLSGTRDLSIIATPPARRLAIKTFVNEYNKNIIREAMLREIMRGGQIYFLHNDVATIQPMAEKLQELMPEARIGIAHGQMRERQLEHVMGDFYHQKFNVLLCTTIVESGIDIPTANTIIINKANHFGLAQLHQLRGRVGRSHHQAYAYLLVNDKKALSNDAQKRLDVLTAMEDLGAGFYLATHDLEIRGAGELLGEEQSGHIEAIGFGLYMELLEEAVKALKEGKEPTLEQTLNAGIEIDLHISSLIPHDYVGDVNLRLTLYKRISNCKDSASLNELKAEMIDRFGLLPEATQHLFLIAEIKQQCSKIGIKKIDLSNQYGYFHFSEKPNVDPRIIIKLIQLEPKKFQLQGADKLRLIMNESNAAAKISAVQQLLTRLTTDTDDKNP